MDREIALRAKLIEQGHDPDEALSPGVLQPYHPRPFPRSKDFAGSWVLGTVTIWYELWTCFWERLVVKRCANAEISAWKAGRISGLTSGLAIGRAEIIEQLKAHGINVDDLLPSENMEDEEKPWLFP